MMSNICKYFGIEENINQNTSIKIRKHPNLFQNLKRKFVDQSTAVQVLSHFRTVLGETFEAVSDQPKKSVDNHPHYSLLNVFVLLVV